MFVLDVLRHDVGAQLSSILKLLNNDGCIGWREFWPHDFTSEEVIPILLSLERAGSVRALHEIIPDDTGNGLAPLPVGQITPADCGDVWFALTARGRRLWEQWEPAVSAHDR